jgi:hypothetical protein
MVILTVACARVDNLRGIAVVLSADGQIGGLNRVDSGLTTVRSTGVRGGSFTSRLDLLRVVSRPDSGCRPESFNPGFQSASHFIGTLGQRPVRRIDRGPFQCREAGELDT